MKNETYQDLENYSERTDRKKDTVDLSKNNSEIKYFTPSIEDIRVGYECEITMKGHNNWRKHTYTKDDLMPHFDPFEKPTIRESEIRVPYLTKEQIEAEGWYKEHIPNVFTGNDEIQEGFSKYINDRLSVHLFYDYEEKTLLIYRQVVYNTISGNWTEEKLFDGECKDINTFRYICKLLNIK